MRELLEMPRLFLDVETWRRPFEGPNGLICTGYAVDDSATRVEFGAPSRRLLRLLADPGVVKVSHSGYDSRWLMLSGVPVEGPQIDTQVMAWVWNENTPLDLEWLVGKYVGNKMDKRLHRSKGIVWFETDSGEHILLETVGRHLHHETTEPWTHRTSLDDVVEQMIRYNTDDVDQLRELFNVLLDRFEASEWTDYWLAEEVPYTPVLRRMETRGMPIDLGASEALREELEVENEAKCLELLEEAGLPASFNLNSPDKLVAYLFHPAFVLKADLVYDVETLDCLKSCVAGEHEDCNVDYEDEESSLLSYEERHVVDFLPEGFIVDSFGRDRVHGHYELKGRGLAPTPRPINKKTGEEGKQPSTSSPELLYMHASDPWVHKLCIEYRKVRKALTTYLRVYPQIAVEVESHRPHIEAADGAPSTSTRIYGTFRQTGTVTGRLSSSGPNLQNQPARGDLGKRMRGLFVGDLIIGDFDQIEMRLMAHFSGDETLTETFRQGKNPHVVTAHAIFGVDADHGDPEYEIGKRINYGIGYGAGARKVAQVLSLEGYPTTPATAKDYLDDVQAMMPGFFEWKHGTVLYAKRKGYVQTIGGRRRHLRGAFKQTAGWKQRGYGERQAINSIIQGSAADIIRRAMIQLEIVVPQARMIAQVHDELVFEYDPGDVWPQMIDAIRETSEWDHGFALRVPLVFEPVFAASWAEKDGGMGDLFEEEFDAE